MECSCEKCVAMCKNRPCWGTPKDIKLLIEKGYAKQLMKDWWNDDCGGDDIYIIVPAIVGSEGKKCPFCPIGTCTFLKNNLCTIHKIKPTEGKESSCKSDKDIAAKRHIEIAKSWDCIEGRKLVSDWKELVGI